MLLGANPRVQGKLEKAGIIELIGQDNSFTAFADALAVCRELAERDPKMAHDRALLLSQTAQGGLDAGAPAASGGGT